MPPSVGIVMVCVLFARMQNGAVVEQLNVTWLEVHFDIERGIVGDALDEAEGCLLVIGQSGRGRMALRVADIPGNEENAGHRLVSLMGASSKNGASPGLCSSLRSHGIGRYMTSTNCGARQSISL